MSDKFIQIRSHARIYKTRLNGEIKYYQLFESEMDGMTNVLSWDSELEESDASTVPTVFIENFVKDGTFQPCGEEIKAKLMLLDSDKVMVNE